MNEIKEQYTVTKAIRFELKAVHSRGLDHKDNINFQKTAGWVNEELFPNQLEKLDKGDLHNKLDAVFKKYNHIDEQFNYLINQIGQHNIPAFCVFIKAQLLENLDSNLFHQQKKGNRVNQTKFIPLTHLKIDDYNWFTSGINKKLQNANHFKVLIKTHPLWEDSNNIAMLNHARWHKNIESFCNRYIEILELFPFICIPKEDLLKKFGVLNETQNDIFKKIDSTITPYLKQEYCVDIKQQLEQVKNIIKNNQFIECGLTSLNSKALNKNLAKRQEQENWLKETLQEQEKLLQKITASDNERKIILDGDGSTKGLYELLREASELWVIDGTDKRPEFAIHLLNTEKYNQGIQDKKQAIEILKQNKKRAVGQEKNNIDNKIKTKKKELTKLKIEKLIIQDRKRLFLEQGVLSFEFSVDGAKDIDALVKKVGKKGPNFQRVWKGDKKADKKADEKADEKADKSYIAMKVLSVPTQLKIRHRDNNQRIKTKGKFSQKYGNNKSLINSLQREIERQGKIEYQSILIRDEHFYYLAFLKREDRQELKNKFLQQANQNSSYQFLEYERLTFKALEKMILIENAKPEDTPKLEDQTLEQKTCELWNDYKKQTINHDHIKITRTIELLIKFINKLGYEFNAKQNYDTIDDFAKDINQQCYKTKWVSFDWSKLLEGENNEKIKLFKIHNKDFSRDKRTYANKKNDLFTQYWLDLFENNNSNIRILPEIDLYKKPKEKELKNSAMVKSRKGKELKGTIKGKRFRENKLYASFRLEFYPEKEINSIDDFNKRLNHSMNPEETYFLGLDRGENELLTYCLIDRRGKIKEIGDWNKDENNFDYAKSIKQFTDTRKELSEKYDILRHADDEERENLESEIKELEKQETEQSILSAQKIKESFCGHILNKINKIFKQYKNVYIVLEDLDKTQNKGDSNKEKALEKTLGGSVYQVIENAIISKFKYYHTKDNKFHGSQLVPNIKRVEDLRIKEGINKFGRITYVKSKDQIGNILFVDDYLTSNMCPECGFCLCPKQEEKRLPKFAQEKKRFISQASIQDDRFSCKKEGEHYKITIKNTTYAIKQSQYLKSDITNSTAKKEITKILTPRLKNQSVYKNNIQGDPFYCPSCGKNTETDLFSEPLLKSGDDVASYNIAKRGLDYVLNPPQPKKTTSKQAIKNNANQPKAKNKNTQPQ